MTPTELALSLDLPKRAVALVLAGGRGSRLKNLTDRRAKPAVYFGGKFRIIDFALSNCLNSGIRRIGVITQYKSHSLLRHANFPSAPDRVQTVATVGVYYTLLGLDTFGTVDWRAPK